MLSKLKSLLMLVYVFCILLPVELIAPGYCKRRRESSLNRRAANKLAICKTCDTFNGRQCVKSRGGCGCYMELKLEKWPEAPCPKGKF